MATGSHSGGGGGGVFASSLQPARAQSEAELGGGMVAVLFTDLADSTSLLDRLGDEAFERLLQTSFALQREALAAHDGREVKTLGDGLMAVFPSALAAVRCAAAMQQRVEAHNREHPREQLGLRAGLNAGETIREEGDYFGIPVVVAKRLCDRAQPGQTVVSDVVRALLGGRRGYRFVEMGALQLKGFSDPVVAFELDWQAQVTETESEVRGEDVRPADMGDEGRARPEFPAGLSAESRTEMVGRTAELEALSQEFGRALEGELRIVLLEGEPGIGKTSLAAQFARRAYEQGALVLFGHSDPEPLGAFQPFVEALSGYVRHAAPEQLRAEIGVSAGVFARMVPAVAERLPEIASAPYGDPEADRYRLFEGTTALLTRISERAAIVLVLDDVHWADKSTLALLRQLARGAPEARMLILGTYREADVGRGHPLRELISERHRGVPLQIVPLGGLSQEEVAELIRAWAGQQAPPQLPQRLWEETEGHPFFAKEVLRHLLETGAIYERRGRLATTAARTGIPASVREVIEQRLARLGEEALDVLTTAAVIGRDFEVSLLEQLSDPVGGDRLLRLLDEATAAQVISPSPETFDRYRFSHALVQECLYEGLSSVRRVRLHRRVAECFERLDAPEREHHLAELARHYFEAAAGSEAFGKAIDYAVAAGKQAVSQLAYEEACEHFERALRALELGRGDPSRRCDILFLLGESRWAAGEYNTSREAFARAAEIAEREQLAEHLAKAALGFGGRIAFQIAVVDDQLISMLKRSLELVGETDSALRARVLARLCEAQTLATPLEERRALADEAIAAARRLGHNEVLAEVLLRTWWATGTPDNLDERLANARELAEITAGLNNLALMLEGHTWLFLALLERGDVDEARRLLERVDPLVDEANQPYLEWGHTIWQLAIAMLDQPPAQLEELVWRALELGQASQNTSAIAIFGGHLIYLRGIQGRLPEMHATAAAIAEHFADMPAFGAALAFVCSEIGLAEEARREFDRLASDDFAGIPRDLFWLTCMDLLAITCGHLQDADRAAVLYQLVEPFADRNVVTGAAGAAIGCVHRHLATLATVMGRFELAERDFEAALARDAELGAEHGRLRSCQGYADMLLRRSAAGDRERARQLVEDTLPETRALGLDGVTAKLEQLQRRISGAVASATGATARRHPVAAARAAVTVRGRETIARLVSGRSDDELQRRFGSAVAQRALLTAMAQGFQPRMAFGFQGDIQLELRAQTDRVAPASWTLHVTGSHASAHHRPTDSAALTIRTDVATFMRLFTGELNPLTAYMQGQVELEGDVTLGPRMIELFGGVKPFIVAENS